MQLKYDVFFPTIPRKIANSVVLLHSMIEDRRTWIKIAPEIATGTGRVVFAPDFRNHGESPWSEKYGLNVLVEDLDEFLQEHDLSRVVLVGHSIGGKVAAVYTLRKPEKVEKLILEDISKKEIQFPVQSVQVYQDLVMMLENSIPKELGKEQMIEIMRETSESFNKMFRIPIEVVKKYDYDLLPIDWSSKTPRLQINLPVNVKVAIDTKLHMDLSGEYDGACLMLCGKNSQVIGNAKDQIDAFFPRMERVSFEGVGHFIHHHMPGVFTRIVIDFINRNPNQLQSKF